MAMHTAGRQKPEHMQRPSASSRGLDCVGQRRVLGEFAGFDRDVDAREILVNDAAGTNIQMADLGIAHLALRQPHTEFRRIDRGMRAGREQPVPVGHPRARDRIVRGVGAASEAVEDQEDDRPCRGTHGSRRRFRCRLGWGKRGHE